MRTRLHVCHLRRTHNFMLTMRIKELLFCLLVCTACNSGRADLFDNATEISSISSFPDSSFFSSISQIECSGDYVYALDYNRRQVIRLNSTMDKMTTFGSGGRGPKELTAPFSFLVKEHEVEILDLMANKLKTYSESGFERSKSLNFSPMDLRFASLGDDLYFFRADSSYLACKVNGDECEGIGKKQIFDTPRRTMLINKCHLFSYQDSLIAVFPALPYAMIMDKDGQESRTIDLATTSFYKNNLKWISNHPDNSDNSYYILHKDACICDNVLYILCPEYSEDYKCNIVMAVDVSCGKVTKLIRLPSDCYQSLGVCGSDLYTFNYTNCTLDRYGII